MGSSVLRAEIGQASTGGDSGFMQLPQSLMPGQFRQAPLATLAMPPILHTRSMSPGLLTGSLNCVAQEMEDFYRRLHGMDGLVPEFPATYPTGALVGCVSVVDVLTVGTLRRK